MANPSKRTPWVVQMFAESVGLWIDLDAYRTEEEAQHRVAFARQQQPATQWRVVSYVAQP
jgi:ABC-type cobalamin transport system ATPase subunit